MSEIFSLLSCSDRCPNKRCWQTMIPVQRKVVLLACINSFLISVVLCRHSRTDIFDEQTAEVKTQSLNGKWMLSNCNGSFNLPAEVPGCVHTALQKQNFIQVRLIGHLNPEYPWDVVHRRCEVFFKEIWSPFAIFKIETFTIFLSTTHMTDSAKSNQTHSISYRTLTIGLMTSTTDGFH